MKENKNENENENKTKEDKNTTIDYPGLESLENSNKNNLFSNPSYLSKYTTRRESIPFNEDPDNLNFFDNKSEHKHHLISNDSVYEYRRGSYYKNMRAKRCARAMSFWCCIGVCLGVIIFLIVLWARR